MPPPARRPLAFTLAACALALAACGKKSTPEVAAAASGAPTPGAATSVAPTANQPVAIDPILHLDACTLGHRGVLLDLGDPSMKSHFTNRLDTPEPESVEHEGGTWARLTSRALSLTFFWSGDIDHREAPANADGGAPSNDSGAYVNLRIRSNAARSVAVYLNGKVVGSKSLQRGDVQVVTLRGGPGAILPGANELTVRLAGGSRIEDDVLAEIDWIHVGSGDVGEAYSAPTRSDALVNATVGGVSKRAVSLRAPGFLRCTTWLPSGGRLEAQAALVGSGEADAEVRLLKDRAMPQVLGSIHVTGGAGGNGKWAKVSIPLGNLEGGGTLGAIELAPVRATASGARVLFGEPRVMGPDAPALPVAARPVARGVVLVVLGSISPKLISPYGGARPMPELAALARGGILFQGHRAASSVASGAFASMLTGLAPRQHTVEDPDARLPRAVTTVADAARQAGVSTALFTANPTTGLAFGFERGWDTYVAHAPTDEASPVLLFDEASRWIEAHKDSRFLVVVHARGGHPPWDATLDEVKAMPPAGYNGTLDPRRAAEILTRQKKAPQKFTEADRARVWALYGHALDEHDAALGRLLTALRGVGREGDTTIVVTGDTAVNEAAPIPFVESDALDESMLSVPLVVRHAGGLLAGKRVTAPTTSLDVARTIMGTLALAAPASFQGADLVQTASGDIAVPERPLVATTATRFAAKWGTFVLSGTREHETKLCDLSLEPTCVTDVRKTYPLATDALHRFVFDTLGPSTLTATAGRIGREPVFLDPATLTQLIAWGRPVEKPKRRRGEVE